MQKSHLDVDCVDL